MAPPAGSKETGFQDRNTFCTILNEWCKDHQMFVSTLAELAGQLAVLEAKQPTPHLLGSRGSDQTAQDIMERVMAQAPSNRLHAFLKDKKTLSHLQRQLPEQLDQNMRLLTVLAAEMNRFVQQLEHLADANAAATAQPEGNEHGTPAPKISEDALLMATVVDGVAKETRLVVSSHQL
jgi:hypothetical protein